MGAGILLLNEDNFDDRVTGLDAPLVVDFWASWCGPCKDLAPVLERLAAEMKGRAYVGQVNIEDSGSLTNRFGIRSIPTLIVFSHGRVVDQMVGNAPLAEIRAMIERHVEHPEESSA